MNGAEFSVNAYFSGIYLPSKGALAYTGLPHGREHMSPGRRSEGGSHGA